MQLRMERQSVNMDRYKNLEPYFGKDFDMPSDLKERLAGAGDNCVYISACPDLLYAENSFESITGYVATDSIGKGIEYWFTLAHPEDRAIMSETVIQIFKQMASPDSKLNRSGPFVLEYRLRHAKGHWMWLRDVKWLLYSGKGDHRLVALLTDISLQRAAEEKREGALRGEKECANRLLDVALRYRESTQKKWIARSAIAPSPRPERVGLLTKREQEILHLIGEGFSTKQISDQLYISINTVETHRRHLLEKLQVKNSMELIKEASKVFWL
jgi:DNA-binding CsgD family transcriptional regulator